jgi:predicted metal-dependent hydrolase
MIIEIGGIGPVRFERSEKAARIRIIVTHKREIRCRVPRGISFERAAKAVKTKENWISRALSKIEQKRPRPTILSSGKIADVKTARLRIGTRLEELAHKYGFTFNRVSFRKQRTRWGSCSQKNNISLNLRLSLLPDHLLDYVLLHELAHTVIKNHGDEFWRMLDKLMGNSKTLRKELRQYS